MHIPVCKSRKYPYVSLVLAASASLEEKRAGGGGGENGSKRDWDRNFGDNVLKGKLSYSVDSNTLTILRSQNGHSCSENHDG